MKQAQKILKDEEIKAYIDPEKAETAREEGNQLFKSGMRLKQVKLLFLILISLP